MFGAIFRQELRSARRRTLLHALRWLGVVFLLLPLLPSLQELADWWLLQREERFIELAPLLSYLSARMIPWLLLQQFLLVVLLAPALTAGTITDLKARRTLQDLLATSVPARDIVLGKWLARALQVACLALLGLPILAVLGPFSELPLWALLAMAVVWVGPLLAVGAVSVLASVWCRSTATAVVAVYAILAAVALAVWGLGGPLRYLSPWYELDPLWRKQAGVYLAPGVYLAGPTLTGPAISSWDLWPAADLQEGGWRLLVANTVWVGIIIVCLGLAAWRLRPAYFSQLDGGTRRAGVVGDRPAVGDDPFRWKEFYVEGLAPFAALRRLRGHSCGGYLVGLLALMTAFTVLVCWPWYSFGQLDFFLRMFLAGLAGFFPVTLVVAVRCSGTVNGEHARNTWETVLLTRLEPRDILRGKVRGILQAALPYGFAGAVPLLGAALFSGGVAFAAAFWFLGMVGLLLYLLAVFGIYCSASTRNPWASLVKTLAGGVGLLAMTLLFVAAAALLICTVLAVLFQTDFGSLGPSRFLVCFLVTFTLLLIWLVRVIATELLIEAEAALGPTPGQPPFRGSPGQSDKSAGVRCEIGPPALR